jgi:hypothetical protein
MSSLTIGDLVRAKQLQEGLLRDLGLRDTAQGVAIPYHDEHGNVLFERTRLSLEGARRFLRPPGVPLAPYGVDRLKSAREGGFLILVEGESDCWTLWHAGFPALGLPGAGAARALIAEHVAGFRQVFVIREPGPGGDTFIRGNAERLLQIGFAGEGFEVSIDGFKDPSDLYCDDPSLFRERFEKVPNNPTAIAGEFPNHDQRSNGFQPLDQYLAAMSARSEKKAYWSGTLREGEVSMLAGRALAGKSTFACALARALTFGDSFLGRECLPSRLGYMALERNGSTVAELLGKWGLRDILFLDVVPAAQGDQLAAWLEEQISQCGLEVIVVDHLQNLVRVVDANDYARVTAALEPFQRVAKRTGAHLILLHHQGKTRREGEIDVMGSEAFRAAADVIIEATRSEGKHYIRANRLGEDLSRTLVTVDLATGEVQAVDAQQADTTSALRTITALLETQTEPMATDATAKQLN